MPFATSFLLWFILPTAAFVAFCLAVERHQRDFEKRNPGRHFGLQDLKAQMSNWARLGWTAVATAIALALLASCLPA